MDSVKSKGKCGAEPGAQAGPSQLDLGELRQRLKDKKGPEFWRSLDELAGSPDFEAMVHREFPRYAAEWPSGFSRRRFLQLSSASMALAGLTGCTKQPIEKIVPYVRQPEQIIPGKPLFFATALTLSGYATGVLAESHEGRPTKVEGNPDHPASLGATDVFAQASILTLYDPDRSQTILRAGRPGTWGAFVGEVSNVLRSLGPTGGDGLRILTGSVTSPTFASQMQALLAAYPRARWHRWEPAAPHQAQAAARRALGAPLDKVYDFTQADVVLTIGSDAFCHGPAGVRYARDFSSRRRVRAANRTMNRLYAVESFPENSSTVADHRLQLPPDQLEAFTLALAQALGVAGAGGAALADETARQWVGVVAEDLRAHSGRSLVVADEFLSPAVQVLVLGINQALGNVGRTLHFTEPVEADPVDQVQSMRELVADMNAGRVELLVMLDGVNPVYTAPADLRFDQALQKVRLRVHHGLYEDETSVHCHWHVNAAHELESWGDARAFDGTVSILQPLIDPLYEGRTASEMLAALGNRPDSTGYDIVREFWSGRLAGLTAGWTGVAATQTESGGLSTTLGMGGFSGTTGGAGAMAGSGNGAGAGTGAPNAAGQNAGGQVTEGGTTGAGSLAQSATADTASDAGAPAAAAGTAAPASFDRDWRRVLNAGLIPNTAARRAGATVNGGAVAQAAGEIAAAAGRRGEAPVEGRVTLLVRPDPTIWDGRFASNAWLQELPKPISKLVWDNALTVSPRTAERLKIDRYQIVTVAAGGRSIEAAVWILPGMADDTAYLTLGYGRTRAGKSTGQGFNAYALRASNALWTIPGVEIRPTDERYELACTQNHHLIGGDQVDEDEEAAEQAMKRHVVQTGTLEEFRANPEFLQERRHDPKKHEKETGEPMTMYPEWEYNGHAWGMAIDLSVCTGCSSCVVACQSENNIPVVGKEQVLAGREMHWLRIDRYFAGDMDSPTIHNQPLPCMHCENAPCEVVCPVAATVHSDEGLNDMVYNRCVGTRYCSNNCPYKVRRFNFLRYAPKDDPLLALAMNPDVTVRMRGVMEKCTYCVQRIEQAKIESKVEQQPIPANWLKTACQQACPTEAIVFGDQNNPEWEVTKWKAEPLRYDLLEEINTRPRTSYLAKLRNPNPALEPAVKGSEHGHA